MGVSIREAGKVCVAEGGGLRMLGEYAVSPQHRTVVRSLAPQTPCNDMLCMFVCLQAPSQATIPQHRPVAP